MNSKHFMGGALIAAALFFGSCQPKDSDLSVTVSQGVHSAAPNVNADVNNGVVTLTGTVGDEATRQAAEDAAKKIAGVKSVVNNITVSPSNGSSTGTGTTVTATGPSGALQQGVVDVTRDYPEVTAVVNGKNDIVLTGQIAADRWTRLKTSLDSLKPRRVNSDSLIIK